MAIAWPADAFAGGGQTWNVGPTLVDKPNRYNIEMMRGDKAAIAAAEYSKLHRRGASYRYARLAIAAYDRAIRARPKAAEPHLRAATVIYFHWFYQFPGRCFTAKARCLKVISHWHAFEKPAPLDPRNQEFLFQRALLYTTLAEKKYYRKAIVDYERLINSTRFATLGRDRATTLGNLAEIYMMTGDVDNAIPMYKRAIALGNDALHAYGLAVALDRDGRGEKARQIMRRYAEGDRKRGSGELRSLTRSGVFFVPRGEVHYYHALGYESQGKLAKAILHYEKFIASKAHAKFQPRAKENLKRLRNQLLKQFTKQPPPTMLTPVLPSN